MTHRGRQADPETFAQIKLFQRYAPGDSFFVGGAHPSDLAYFRRAAVKRGLGVSIEKTDNDPIYYKAGVRVRREKGPYDDM